MGVTLNSKEIKGKVNTTGLIATVGLIGSRGAKGDQGEQGNDGFSPIITTSKSGKVTTLTITDASGTKTATINDGADGSGSGDMLTSVYDQNLNGIVDNAEKVNNHTVESDVPSNAVFTDTTYTAGTGIDITNNVISNTQTSAEWGNITGTLNSQTDLKNALDAKQDVINSSNKLPYSYVSGTPTIPTKLSDLTNDNNTVTDASYVHTDNNYTTAEKNKLAGVDDIIVVGSETPTSQTEILFEETDLDAQYVEEKNIITARLISSYTTTTTNYETLPLVNYIKIGSKLSIRNDGGIEIGAGVSTVKVNSVISIDSTTGQSAKWNSISKKSGNTIGRFYVCPTISALRISISNSGGLINVSEGDIIYLEYVGEIGDVIRGQAQNNYTFMTVEVVK